MKVLVTGSAGFIGSALTIRLLDRGNTVIGIDNHNDYYDQALKEARLERHNFNSNYTHIRMDLEDNEALAKLFEDEQFDGVVNLAAQAGVRYSITNPMAFINSNLVGFANILEGCKNNKIGHLVYASSSSTYGLNTKQPFSTHSAFVSANSAAVLLSVDSFVMKNSKDNLTLLLLIMGICFDVSSIK